eukprot:scaffold22583_cov106-Cylindrotheca_fusiformis.AAC.36
MDNWVVSQISFWFTVNTVKPAQIVDKAIDLFLDIVTPGGGAGEKNVFMKGWRAVEQGFNRADREVEIRNNLRRWDNQYPEIHHELIVRWISGAVVSLAITSIYNGLKPRPKRCALVSWSCHETLETDLRLINLYVEEVCRRKSRWFLANHAELVLLYLLCSCLAKD